MIERIVTSSVAGVALGLLLVASPAGATDPLDGDRLDAIADAIDLDAETRDRIREISAATRQENAPRRAEIRRHRALLRAMLEQDPPDEGRIFQQVDDLSALQRELWKTRLGSMIRIRALLTPAQREQLVKIRANESRDSNRACREDVRTVCPNAVDARTSVECLIERRDDISDGCRDSLSKGPLARFFPSGER